ncbi:glycerophosphodiester phosphodiesterase family protein [Altererythrobacter fulvus]|uniref:glycerophosphodiester phosphodiesterase family protein n=1 Tax=Caenibius fulvus TaxID=2126012 RepID=UPI003018192C
MRKILPCVLAAALLPATGFAAPDAKLPEPKVPVANPFASVHDLFDCTRDTGTLVSAHRGGAAPGYPENAIETAAHTLSQFPVLVEVDVRRTKDGVLVLMHDDTLDRTSTGTGPVEAQTWSALSQLYLEDNDGNLTTFRIPRLSTMAEWAHNRALVLAEVKDSDALPQMIREIRAAGAQANFMLLVNSLEDAKRVQELDPTISITFEMADAAALARAKEAGIDMKRVIAWTGIGKRDRAYWNDLRAQGLTVSYGTLWFIDGAVENLDLKGIYAELAQDGVALLATDRAVAAQAEIAQVRPIEAALRQCKAVGMEPK